MRLAMEIPRAWLEVLSPLCDYDFAIAHQVLEDSYYADFYKKQVEAGRFVVLDNGFHELGHPLSCAELAAAADRVKPAVVVAPDKLGDYKFGLEQYEELRSHLPREIGIACVLCGTSPAERAEFFMKTKDCDMLCLPFREARFEWYCDLLQKIPTYVKWPPRIHLLGVNEFWELKAFRDKFDAMGVESRRITIDTSKPIKYGVRRKRFSKDLVLRGLGPLAEVSKEAKGEAFTDVLYNIAFLRKYL